MNDPTQRITTLAEACDYIRELRGELSSTTRSLQTLRGIRDTLKKHCEERLATIVSLRGRVAELEKRT